MQFSTTGDIHLYAVKVIHVTIVTIVDWNADGCGSEHAVTMLLFVIYLAFVFFSYSFFLSSKGVNYGVGQRLCLL